MSDQRVAEQLQMAELAEAVQDQDLDEVFRQNRQRMRRDFDDAEQPNYRPENQGTFRQIAKLESRQQLSGCVFCCVGTIIFLFGSFLIRKGDNSQRSEELYSYVTDVANWENSYREQFMSLRPELVTLEDDRIAFEKQIGESRAEIDVAIALGRIPAQAQRKELGLNDLYHDFGRRLETDYSKIRRQDLKIDYTPVRYRLNLTTDENNKPFLETVHTLQVSKSQRALSLAIGETLLESPEFDTLKEIKNYGMNMAGCEA